jgi:predicted glycoside hydrolase/deacetylase ChbG (UPF0249 family)
MEVAADAPSSSSPHLRRTLLVVADDLGYCGERDRGIIEGFAGGAVGGTKQWLHCHKFAPLQAVTSAISHTALHEG